MSTAKDPFFKSFPSRRGFLRAGFGGAAGALVMPALAGAREIAAFVPNESAAPQAEAFELSELTVTDLQKGLASGKYTARSLSEKYLARI